MSTVDTKEFPAAGLTTGKMSQLDDPAIDAVQPVAGVNAGISVVFGLLGNAQQLAVDVRISGIIGERVHKIECAVSDVVQKHGIGWHSHSSHGARTRSGSFGFDAGIPSMISISSGTYITAVIFFTSYDGNFLHNCYIIGDGKESIRNIVSNR